MLHVLTAEVFVHQHQHSESGRHRGMWREHVDRGWSRMDVPFVIERPRDGSID